MVINVAGGLMIMGLLFGAITGSIWFMAVPVTIGLLIIGIYAILKQTTISNWKYKQYPPYGY